MSLGETIKTARKKAGLSQMQLGIMCGYTGRSAESTVQHWEHDRVEPSIKILRKLADALQISLDDLIP